MSAKEILKSSEASALKNNQFISHVKGKSNKKSLKKKGSLSVVGFLGAMIVIIVALFGSGNIIPTTIYERLIEETDMQCADMIMSKNLVFQQALESGDLPDDTTKLLKNKGILVGYLDNNGNFVEQNKGGVSLSLKKGDEIISANDLINKLSVDTQLYSSVNDATYGCAAYYYDESAMEVFDEIGTRRNNFTSDADLNNTMNKIMGKGSDINVNSVSQKESTKKNPNTGADEIYYEYIENGKSANSNNNATDFINNVRDKNTAANINDATLNSANALMVADTISSEQRSSLFFALFMENISKMKAGDGNESKINDVMNYLYTKSETEVVDVKTGELTKVEGTALESPSLYALLSGNKVNLESAGNYSTERILKTVENKVGQSGNTAISGTVASSTKNQKGSIGRFINNGIESGSSDILSLVEPTVSKSLNDNSYDSIKGIDAGEELVEGAITLGSKLAKKSGATAGDAEAVESYARLNSKILAMNTEVDRMNRSPFDITSKNTFLGSIVYKFAVASLRFSGIFSSIKTFSTNINSAISSLFLSSYADTSEGFLKTFGDCETYGDIGAVGSAGCAEISVFDTSTLNNPFHDAGFINFVNNNTTLDSSGVRKIKDGSKLANFISYNNEKKTPLGVIDGGILNSLSNNSNSVSFMTDILKMVEVFLESSDQDKRIASGEVFINSSNNPDWQTYKYAQRYVALARATSTLRQYSDDKTAYNDMKFFEGYENPVTAFLHHYYNDIATNH